MKKFESKEALVEAYAIRLVETGRCKKGWDADSEAKYRVAYYGDHAEKAVALGLPATTQFGIKEFGYTE